MSRPTPRSSIHLVGRCFAARLHSNESGVALLMVVGFGMVMLLMVATALSFSVSGLIKAGTDQNWNGAMAAAYAGVEEYESRIASDNAYIRYGDPTAAFSAGSTLSLPTGVEANPAFGIGAAGTWATVSGTGSTGSFRYEVDNSRYAASGVLRIRSTGRVGNTTRSVVANLRQKGFIDYLYFTDFEKQDPAQSGETSAECAKYSWAGRPKPPVGHNCGEIAFDHDDTINGPVHSNDTLRICRAHFTGKITTGNTGTGDLYLKETSSGALCGNQDFSLGPPTSSPVIAMPTTNSELKRETRSDLAEVPRPGCLYTGPTKITFGSGGTMTVRSPWTKVTNIAGAPATSGTTPAACGAPGATGLGSATGVTLPVIDTNLIFVQNVPATPGDPNYSSATALPALYTPSTCTNGNGIGYPVTNEWVNAVSTSYGCRNGDVFVAGDLDGAVTVASENFIYVTGDLRYVDAQSDILGLIAQNAVWVWNPVSYCSSCGYDAFNPTDRRIDAALLSMEHTILVQNYDRGGAQGTLTVKGSLAQKFRGIVSGSGNGYVKNYVYDQRFRYVAPPKFLSPISTTYGVTLLVEVKTAFATTGAAIP